MVKTILVADDSRTIQEAVRLVLQTEGYRLVACESGAQALEKARELEPQLVLADLGMGGGDGAWLTEQLRADPEVSEIPVLLLHPASVNAPEDIRQRIGANDCLGKPFLSSDLLKAVRKWTTVKEPSPKVGRSRLADRISRMEEVLARRGGPEVVSPARVNAPAIQRAAPAFVEAPSASVEPSRGPSVIPEATASSGLETAAWQFLAAAPTRAQEGAAPELPPQLGTDAPGAQAAAQEAGAPITREDLLDAVRQIAWEVVERAVWEMVPDIAEKILWEVIPEVTETLVREQMEKDQDQG